MDQLHSIGGKIIQDFLALFYLVPITPSVSYDSFEDVPDYVAQSVPYFLLLAVLEWLYGRLIVNRELYTLKDTVMSISLGIVQQLGTLWIKEIALLPYIYLYEACQPIRENLFKMGPFNSFATVLNLNLDANPVMVFIIGFLGCDLGYYIMHRCAHEWHLLWSGHSVHHSGERFNLAAALRQGVFQPIYSWIFYLFLAVIGLPPVHFVRHNRLNTVYQFWVHTEAIGRLPWLLELVLNTPSHHRVHHRPPGNCNYAGVLIIWDRLFCTFISEYSLPVTSIKTKTISAAPTDAGNEIVIEQESHRGILYGLAKPLDTYDPVYANLSHFIRMVFGTPVATGAQDSVSIITRIWQILCFIPKWRIHKPWRVARSLQEFMPDVLHDWEQEQFRIDQQAKAGQHGLVHYLIGKCERGWEAFGDLPLEVTVDHQVKPRPKEIITLSTRDEEFLQGRMRREAPTLTVFWGTVIFFHFFITLAISYAAMEMTGDSYYRAFKALVQQVVPRSVLAAVSEINSCSSLSTGRNASTTCSIENDWTMENGDDMAAACTGAITISLVCIVSVLSLQSIKLHYLNPATSNVMKYKN